MKTTNPDPLENEFQLPKNEETSSSEAEVGNREAGGWASPSSSSSSPSSGGAAPNQTREAPDNPQPSTKNPQPASPRATGRPTKLTPHLTSAICHQICEFGSSDTAAAAHFGIPASTLSRWKFLNPDLELRFASSREDFRNRHIHKLQSALTRDGRHDWRASAWLLERIFPQDYARRPGRRVNPASEERTWLDQAVAADTAADDRIFRRQFESACQQGLEAARNYVSQPAWDDFEPNATEPLPITASFDAKHQGPASLPSYVTYAEALELALHFDAKKTTIDFPLPTSSSSSLSRHPRTSADINGDPAVAPACSETLGGAEAPPSPDLRRGEVAGGAERNASPESAHPLNSGASRNDGVSPSCNQSGEAAIPRHDNSEITETVAQSDARLPLHHHLHLPQKPAPQGAPTSEITETPAAFAPAAKAPALPVFPVLPDFPFPPLARTTTATSFQNYRNSHSSPQILTSQIPAEISAS